ncbi:MAG: hypothetical protein NTY80_04475 [candidate division SR1 bacterium]|nr:hypothetical protein [candidate division SR1 bacterium]
MQSPFRYSWIQKKFKTVYRIFFPISKSAYTIGEVDDICSIELVPPEDLKGFFTSAIQLLQKTKGKEIGDYLEFGVFNGSSLSNMYLSCKKMGLSSVRFFGFDAFEGLSADSENEDDGVWKKGFYACSFEKMNECLRKKGIDPNDINWIKGWYQETLTETTIKQFDLKKIGIIFIDCDTYSSSKIVLNFIKPLLKEEMILCFDDWKLNDLDIKEMGEYRSFNEFLEENTPLEATEIKSYNRKSKSFLIRPKVKK